MSASTIEGGARSPGYISGIIYKPNFWEAAKPTEYRGKDHFLELGCVVIAHDQTRFPNAAMVYMHEKYVLK